MKNFKKDYIYVYGDKLCVWKTHAILKLANTAVFLNVTEKLPT